MNCIRGVCENVGTEPVEGVVVKEQDAGELTRGVEVGPVNPGAAVSRGGEDVGLERWVERG